ncbi:MAG: pyridoxamine 5'-phosphate oxidase [Acidobacteriota bacterium]
MSGGSIAADPISEFKARLALAAAHEAESGTAMTLATVDASGQPSARIVLLKSVDARGFSFFTNYGSRKARALDWAGRAALCWFWPSIAQQVRAEGTIERVEATESDAYFASRPRGSQIGAWASRQSEMLPDRATLVERVDKIEAKFAGQPIPRPPFWGGYRLSPERVEFWTGEESRLHHRWLYRLDGSSWATERLYP